LEEQARKEEDAEARDFSWAKKPKLRSDIKHAEQV
jgi:hypothetical protein